MDFSTHFTIKKLRFNQKFPKPSSWEMAVGDAVCESAKPVPFPTASLVQGHRKLYCSGRKFQSLNYCQGK